MKGKKNETMVDDYTKGHISLCHPYLMNNEQEYSSQQVYNS
jgi:hypothetical protein